MAGNGNEHDPPTRPRYLRDPVADIGDEGVRLAIRNDLRNLTTPRYRLGYHHRNVCQSWTGPLRIRAS